MPLTTAWLDTSLLSTISKGMDKIIWNLDLKYFTNADAIYRLIGLIIWNFKHILNTEKAFSRKHSSCLQVDFFTLDQASLLFDDWKVNGRYVLKCQIEILPNLINSVLFVGISSTVRNSNKWNQMSLHYLQGMNEINDIWNLDLKHFTNEDAICKIIGVIIVNSKHI